MTPRPLKVLDFFVRGDVPVVKAETKSDSPTAAQASPPPSWNNSTTVMRIIRDRLSDGLEPITEPEPPLYGPAPQLPRRPRDLGQGLWR